MTIEQCPTCGFPCPRCTTDRTALKGTGQVFPVRLPVKLTDVTAVCPHCDKGIVKPEELRIKVSAEMADRAAECIAELPQDLTLRHIDRWDLADAMLRAALNPVPAQ